MIPDSATKILACDPITGRPSASTLTYPPWKRALDLSVGSILLIAGLPIVLLAAAAIKIADGGAVIFWQRRVGEGGRAFWFPKLRSMCVGAEDLRDMLIDQNDHGESITFKMRQDPRVTRIGRALRMLSIDELPQLWCVLKGEMSLVGPRPPLPIEVQKYTPLQRRRLESKPGITGLWQVSGRSTIPFDGQLALDVEYLQRQSLLLDLHILMRTVGTVLSCKGAW